MPLYIGEIQALQITVQVDRRINAKANSRQIETNKS